MPRHWLAFTAATALSAASAPALAQSASPPPPQPAPTVPYSQRAPDAHAVIYAQGAPALPAYTGAPYAPPMAAPPGVPMPGALWAGGAVANTYGAMQWQGGPGPVAGPSYAYGAAYAAGAVPCGCGGGYTVNWVPIQVDTRYSYSPAIRHEHQVVEIVVVPHEVVETRTVRVRPRAQYVKTTRPTKFSKVTK
jgi:hypothetical protein